MVGSMPGEDSIIDNNTSNGLFSRQIKDLYEALDADSISTALRIIEGMGDDQNSLAVEPLTVLLEYPDESIQAGAATALGKIGDKSAVQPLLNALKRSSDKVNISVVTALGMFGDKSVIGPIESIPLTPDEPRLINAVRSTVYKLKHPEGPDTSVAEPEEGTSDVDLVMLVEKKLEEKKPEPPENQKSPILAAVCSFLVPGLGQVYNGEGYGKGFMYYIGIYVGYLLLIIPGFAIWVYSIYNAYTTATKINTGEVVKPEPSLVNILLYAALTVIVIPLIITVILIVLIFALIFPMYGYPG
jgi:TM2 domain-containing membrane protein YozV